MRLVFSATNTGANKSKEENPCRDFVWVQISEWEPAVDGDVGTGTLSRPSLKALSTHALIKTFWRTRRPRKSLKKKTGRVGQPTRQGDKCHTAKVHQWYINVCVSECVCVCVCVSCVSCFCAACYFFCES